MEHWRNCGFLFFLNIYDILWGAILKETSIWKNIQVKTNDNFKINDKNKLCYMHQRNQSTFNQFIFEEILSIDKRIILMQLQKIGNWKSHHFLGSVKSWILKGYTPWTSTGDSQAEDRQATSLLKSTIHNAWGVENSEAKS